MSKDIFPMTEAGLKKVTAELTELENEKREQAKARIRAARSFCDFNEDPEYEKAIDELSRIDDRISTLSYKIQHVKLIEQTDSSSVELGSTVTFKDVLEEEVETYTIVGSEEADPLKGTLSNQSQVAQALLGKQVNDEVNIQTPGGNRHIKIINIS